MGHLSGSSTATLRSARFALVIVAFTVLAVPRAEAAPGTLSTTQVSFGAPVPCGASCPYLLDSHLEAFEHTVRLRGAQDPATKACRPEPLAPPMSWDDIAIVVPDEIAGRVPIYLALAIYPNIDRDAFLCRVFDPGTPGERWEPIRGQCDLCGFIWPECSASPPHSGLGCPESVGTAVTPGMTIVMRVFNQADSSSCPGRYRFFG